MQSDEKKSVGFFNCNVLPEKKSWQSFFFFFLRNIVAELWKAKRCTVRIFKRMILYMSVFEGGIFANVSTPG